MAIDFPAGAGRGHYAASSAVLSATPITMAAWFNVDNTTGSHTLLSIDSSSGQHRWMLQADGATAGDPVVAYAAVVAGAQAASTSGFSSGQWHHGAAVFESSTSRTAYLDGGNSATNTTNLTPSTIDGTRIGARRAGGTPGSYCDGRIAEAAIWSAALTAEEIAALADGVKPSQIRPQSLVLYCPLINDQMDVRGGLNLTVQNSGLAIATHCRRFG